MSNPHDSRTQSLPNLLAQASSPCFAPLSTPLLSPDLSDAAAISLLHTLVGTPSLSGQESRVAQVIQGWCESRHIPCEVDQAGNAVASFGPVDARPLIILLGHMDTFPGAPPVRIENGTLFGRGSVDAKGPLAAFLVAAARSASRLTSRVLVIGAVEEETTTSRGARHIASRYTPDACIIGEPSGTNGYTIGYKGRLVIELRVARSGAHSAGPAGSAADAAFDWWTRVLADVEGLNSGRTGAFDRLQASIRSTNCTHDGITDVAALLAGFRLPTWMNPGDLAARLPALPEGASLSIAGAERAIRVDRSSSVARALSGAIRAQGLAPTPLVKTGTSDMNVVGATWDCPIAAYGPGDSALDHTPNEHLSLADYITAINILQHTLTSGTL